MTDTLGNALSDTGTAVGKAGGLVSNGKDSGTGSGGGLGGDTDLQARSAARQDRGQLGLLGDLQSIIHLDAEVAHRALQFCVAEEKLHSTQIPRAPIDQ